MQLPCVRFTKKRTFVFEEVDVGRSARKVGLREVHQPLKDFGFRFNRAP